MAISLEELNLVSDFLILIRDNHQSLKYSHSQIRAIIFSLESYLSPQYHNREFLSSEDSKLIQSLLFLIPAINQFGITHKYRSSIASLMLSFVTSHKDSCNKIPLTNDDF